MSNLWWFQADIRDILEKERERVADIRSALSLQPDGHLDSVLCRYLSMMEGACLEAPFKVNEAVELAHTPEIGPNHGWICAKHFLVQGAKGRVVYVQLDRFGWRIGVEFDDESFIIGGVKHPVTTRKAIYCFRASDLTSVKQASEE